MANNLRGTHDEFSVGEFIENDPEVAAALEDAEARSEILNELVHARKVERHMSQRAVADEMETTQSAISELESGATDPRLSTLQRYGRAVGRKLVIEVTHVRAVDTAVEEFARLDRVQRPHTRSARISGTRRVSPGGTINPRAAYSSADWVNRRANSASV